MAATAPGEQKKLLTRHRPVRSWTELQFFKNTDGNAVRYQAVLCRKLHLFLGKSTKTAATKTALFDSNMHQIVCRLGLSLRPHLSACLCVCVCVCTKYLLSTIAAAFFSDFPQIWNGAGGTHLTTKTKIDGHAITPEVVNAHARQFTSGLAHF